MSPHTAWITMADRMARGSGASVSTRNANATSTTRAAKTPVICVWPPERREAAVLDSEPATPIPPESPAARLAVPAPTNS